MCGREYRRENTGWGDTTNGISSSRVEDYNHELSVWSIRLGGWSYVQPKKQICEGAIDKLSFEPIELEVPLGYLSTSIYARHCTQGVLESLVDISCPQVSKMLLANRSGAEVRGIW